MQHPPGVCLPHPAARWFWILVHSPWTNSTCAGSARESQGITGNNAVDDPKEPCMILEFMPLPWASPSAILGRLCIKVHPWLGETTDGNCVLGESILEQCWRILFREYRQQAVNSSWMPSWATLTHLENTPEQPHCSNTGWWNLLISLPGKSHLLQCSHHPPPLIPSAHPESLSCHIFDLY